MPRKRTALLIAGALMVTLVILPHYTETVVIGSRGDVHQCVRCGAYGYTRGWLLWNQEIRVSRRTVRFPDTVAPRRLFRRLGWERAHRHLWMRLRGSRSSLFDIVAWHGCSTGMTHVEDLELHEDQLLRIAAFAESDVRAIAESGTWDGLDEDFERASENPADWTRYWAENGRYFLEDKRDNTTDSL